PAAPARVRPRAHWPRPALRTGYEGAPESKAGSGFGFALLQPQIRSLIHDPHTATPARWRFIRCRSRAARGTDLRSTHSVDPRALGVSSGADRAQPGGS